MKLKKKAAVERQVIVTWHTPDEKLPPEYMSVVVTFSGKTKNVIYSHALGLAECCHEYDYDEPAWAIEGLSVEDSINMHVEAWADLDSFGMDEGEENEQQTEQGGKASRKR